jgi:hypothetical protein
VYGGIGQQQDFIDFQRYLFSNESQASLIKTNLNQRQAPLRLASSNNLQLLNVHAFCASRQPSSLLPRDK